jgi:putative FmdB family regulatory protein
MPIYEYRCESCSGTFEVLTSFAERDRSQACPSCSSKQTRVLVSTFAFAGGAAEALDFGEKGASGGCCGGGCGSCGCGSASTLN